jgi:hypothetical protein
MRYLLFLPLLLLVFIPTNAEAITGQAVRFEPGLGQPETMADSTSACNNEAEVLFIPGLGQPEAMVDSSATCTAAVGGGGGENVDDVVWFE